MGVTAMVLKLRLMHVPSRHGVMMSNRVTSHTPVVGIEDHRMLQWVVLDAVLNPPPSRSWPRFGGPSFVVACIHRAVGAVESDSEGTRRAMRLKDNRGERVVITSLPVSWLVVVPIAPSASEYMAAGSR